MKHSLYLLAALIVLYATACENNGTFADVYEDMEVFVLNEDNLVADSNAQATVNVRFGEKLLPDQSVTITTSHGKLYSPPYSPDSAGASSITQTPFSDETSAQLRVETLEPESEVLVSATINGFTVTTTTSFLPALPEDLLLSADKELLSMNDTNINITADFYRAEGQTSNGIRFEPRATIEAIDSMATTELLWNLPDFVITKDNQVTVPLKIIQYVPNSQLRVFLTGEARDGSTLEKSVLLRLQ